MKMIILICVVIWSSDAVSAYIRRTVPNEYLEGKQSENDAGTKYLVSRLLEDIQTAIGDIISRHSTKGKEYTKVAPSGQVQSMLLPLYFKNNHWNHYLQKRSSDLTVLSNMKQFFSDMKQSLDTNGPVAIHDSSSTLSSLHGNTGYVPPASNALSFALPQHIRRMMFGSQHSQPYAHSALGR